MATKPFFEATDWRELGKDIERILDQNNASEEIRKFLNSITELDKKTMVQLFRVGSVNGVWYHTDNEYRILFISNSKKGNGNFDAALEWFETSCKRDGKTLVFEEILSQKFAKHLIEKRGFEKRNKDCIKAFKQK